MLTECHGVCDRELKAAGYVAHVLRKVGFELYELVEGGYSAAELRSAGYDIDELKEVGFTAGALREAKFTSRQLHAARYGLREMQEGGYSWKDLGARMTASHTDHDAPPLAANLAVSVELHSHVLILSFTALPFAGPVIFLRATHAELTRAGYADLDPLHELFLLYRDKEDDEVLPDVSILSPRHAHAAPSPRGPGTPRAEHGVEQYVQVGEAPAKLRRGVALTSKSTGVLSPGTKLRVLDTRTWTRDGTQRACVASTQDEEGVSHTILPLGWVTASLLRPSARSSSREWTNPSSSTQTLFSLRPSVRSSSREWASPSSSTQMLFPTRDPMDC